MHELTVAINKLTIISPKVRCFLLTIVCYCMSKDTYASHLEEF